jgi:hypothetical protein
MHNNFTLKEVRKLVLVSSSLCILIAGTIGYFLGTNSEQAKLNKMLLAKAQEEQRLQAESKAKIDKYFAPLYNENSKIESKGKGY